MLLQLVLDFRRPSSHSSLSPPPSFHPLAAPTRSALDTSHRHKHQSSRFWMLLAGRDSHWVQSLFSVALVGQKQPVQACCLCLVFVVLFFWALVMLSCAGDTVWSAGQNDVLHPRQLSRGRAIHPRSPPCLWRMAGNIPPTSSIAHTPLLSCRNNGCSRWLKIFD